MKDKKEKREKSPEAKRLYLSILLALIALISIVAASVAWFTIADFTKVYSMGLDVTTGTNLRFDLDPHPTYEQYVKTLNFSQIANRIKQDKGYDMRNVPLEPVTTSDYRTFHLEDGTIVSNTSGSYLEFTLHFMATKDMLVHLTSANSQGQTDGTGVNSSNANLPPAMRISFSVDGKFFVYDPGMGDGASQSGNVTTFGLNDADHMILNDNNQLFWLTANVNKEVIVRVWLEGTDPECTDQLRKADYSISLRFVGTDKDHNILDGSR
ncbi:MAG: hypothetical protein J6Q02_06980 [Lachnospiraceae bacterium]|nr:hypothetical protein [Lachnospiraceae bacterium]MBP5282414.1 hypothetical protein [Lachnospiraceae bacterium]